MSKPKVFISSTFRDLENVREELNDFIESKDFEPVAFENYDIPFEPNHILEESCYDAVSECSMLILIIKSNFGSQSQINDKSRKILSITSNEYITAKKLGIPSFVFIHSSTYDEYQTYKRSENKSSFTFNVINDKRLVKLINLIYEDSSSRYIFKYSTMSDIKRALRKQWAGLFHKYLLNQRKYFERQKQEIHINPYKFFFFRRSNNISQAKLSERSGIKVARIAKGHL